MSVKIMTEVWGLKMPTAQKLVLLSMADHADDDGENAYPSIKRVAERCSMSARSVQYALRGLEESGHLVIVRAANQHSPTRYRVVPGVQNLRGAESAGRRIRQPGVQNTSPRGADSAPNPSGTIKNHPPQAERARETRRLPADEALTDERLRFALNDGLSREAAEREWAKMRDHRFRDPHSDWDAVWRNWVRREVERGGARASPRSRPMTADERSAEAIRNVKQKYALPEVHQ